MTKNPANRKQISVKKELSLGFFGVIVLLLFVGAIALFSQHRSTSAVDKLIAVDAKLAFVDQWLARLKSPEEENAAGKIAGRVY